VLAAKYQWHLPLYRQAQTMTTQGVTLDRSTLAFWVGYAAAELAPVYGRLKPSARRDASPSLRLQFQRRSTRLPGAAPAGLWQLWFIA
jgi:hypothetical protein